MRILISGDRYWTNKELIREVLVKIPGNHIIIHGGCRGADILAGEVAQELAYQVLVFPADWKKYSKAAGVIRNKQMLEEGKPEILLAFHNDIEVSKGTKNMIEQAKNIGLKYWLFKEN